MQKADVPSPCIRHCCLNENDLCVGCWRSLDEIIRWSNAKIEEREEILKRVKVRGENLRK